MKNSWSVYVIVAVISALAGVAIAGTPQSSTTQPTISAPASTSTTLVVTPETTLPESSSTTSVEPTPTTSTTSTTTTSTLPEIDRSEVRVVAVNGASVSGLAGRTRDELQDAGYELARSTDGSTTVEQTAVYFFPGFEREAELVAEDLDLDPSLNAAAGDAPDFGALDDDHVAVYLGRDRS